LFGLGVTVLAGALTLTTVGVASFDASPTQTKTTKSYVFELSVGMAERMWTPAEVRARHPKTGEVMLAGTMGGAMSMGGSARHVEVQIVRRSTGRVVGTAHPTITLVDLNVENAMAMKVPFAMMRGVDEGAADVHYGNNVDLVAGHRYRVTVTLTGEQAVFQVKAP
jgi:hypothetical protein